MTAFVLIILIALAFHLYRQHLNNKQLKGLDPVPFDGELYILDETVFAIRSGSNTGKTIICFPGFTETMSYFVDLYKEQDCQLILINNALYHSPFSLNNATSLSHTNEWKANPSQPGTIEYDGYHLARVIAEYATGTTIIAHGHSRGGAVILEAGRQFPHITKQVGKTTMAILEAAVVPQGTTVAPNPGKFGRAIATYLMPLGFRLYSKISRKQLLNMSMMKPTNDLKTDLVLRSFRSPKFYWVYIINVNNIPEWQATQSYPLYDNYDQVVLFQGQRDDVLENHTMEASVLAGSKLNEGVRIIRTQNTNHFVALEQPHYIREVVAAAD